MTASATGFSSISCSNVAMRAWRYVRTCMPVLVTAFVLKSYYSRATAQQLDWILGPVAGLVSLLTGTAFTFVENTGYVSSHAGITIVSGCSGINFLIICFCMLSFMHLHRARTLRTKAFLLAGCACVSLYFTIMVNTARIIVAMSFPGSAGTLGWLTPGRLHRLQGICVYFSALILLCFSSELLMRRFARRSSVIYESSRRPIAGMFVLSFPAFCYIASMIGVPVLRGVFRSNTALFIEHSVFVLIAVPAVCCAVFLVGLLVRGLRSLSMAGRILTGILCIECIVLFLTWNFGAQTHACFDRGKNGLWIGHRWYGSAGAFENRQAMSREIAALAETLRENHVKYAYVRAGPVNPEGELPGMPGQAFFELKTRVPDVFFIPWLTGNAAELDFNNPQWRENFLQSLGQLYSSGVSGIHLDIEPLSNNHPGYVDLLREIRNRFDGGLFVSQATRRVAPMGLVPKIFSGTFWSSRFYRDTMRQCDQTVLMGYNTGLGSSKLYKAYMKHQTKLLLKWASEFPEHGVVIGIPAYEHVPLLSNPAVENPANAISGVRAALEGHARMPDCFEGVSVYAAWTTNPDEWSEFRKAWLNDK